MEKLSSRKNAHDHKDWMAHVGKWGAGGYWDWLIGWYKKNIYINK